MMYRTNKPMPESPRIYEKVLKAARGRGPSTFVIPWSDFVFSTRDGKPFMPPTLAKGIDAVSRSPREFASRTGVNLNVFPALLPSGSYAGDAFLIETFPIPEIVRHETLHFVQSVGDNLIRMAKGDPTAFTMFGLTSRLGGEPFKPATEKVMRAHIKGQGSGLYGGPKRRSATMGKGVPLGRHSPGQHALLDAEFQTDALDVAHGYVQEYGKVRMAPEGVALRMLGSSKHLAFAALLPPLRRKDFTRIAFQRTAEMLGISTALTPSVKRALGETVRPAQPAAKPRRERPAALPPAAVSGGHRVVRERVNGREVFSVYKGSTPTGKYAYSEEKALAIMGKMR